MNLHSVLVGAARQWPGHIAVIDVDAPGGERRFSYSEFRDTMLRLAGGLQSLGLRPGDRVAMLIGNSWEFIAAFYAISAAGLVSVPMNTRLLESELAHTIKDSGARLLLAQHSLLGTRAGLSSIPELGTLLVRAPAGVPEMRFEDLGTQGPGAAVNVAPDALASLVYTSGTTGMPKGAMLAHETWIAVSDLARDCLALRQPEVMLHTAALTHGSGYMVLPTFAVGGTNVTCARFDPARTLSHFSSYGVTSGFFVPTMIRMLLDVPGPPRLDLPTLRNLYYAGSPIDPVTLGAAMERFGPVLIQSFAQTEAPMFLTVLDQDDHRRIGEKPALIRSAGRVVRGAEVRIVDDDDQDVRPGEMGEIAARAPHVMKGYWNRPEATAETLRGGWLHTGDIGRFDAGGYLYVMERKKDMIISGGSNVYAREVEEALLGLGAIREVAVIGLPHPKWGEVVTAVLVSRDGSRVEDAAMDAFCRANLADYRRPKRFIWVERLPRNAYGKVLKRELRMRYSTKDGQHA